MGSRERERTAMYDAIDNITDRMRAEKAHLVELDSVIGDADHGTNLERGFTAVQAELDGLDDPSPEEIARTAGTALLSEVGGASGPLFGGSCAHASAELADGVTAATTIAFAEAYLEKVQDRGDATVGAKTMVDALTPAVHTYRKSIEEDDLPPLEALAKAVDACRRGVEFTVPIKAKKGRASYLDWRSVGHQDPGATSTLYILEEILATAEQHLDEGSVSVDASSPTIPDEKAEGNV
jgi:dihydroxyacetone kinase-like protein